MSSTKLNNFRCIVEKLIHIKQTETSGSITGAETKKLLLELEKLSSELDTEKIAAEAKAEKYAGLFDFAPSGYFIVDKKGKIVELNQTGAKMLQMESSLLKGVNISRFLTPETQNIFSEFLSRVFTSQMGQSCEVQLLHQGKYASFAHFEGIVLKKSNTCMLTVVNIDEFKKTKNELVEIRETARKGQKKLKEKSNLIHKIIESSALSTWISDEKGTAILVNPACLDFFGTTEEEVIGKYNLFKDEVILEKGLMPEIHKVFDKGQIANITIEYNFGDVRHVSPKNGKSKTVNSIFTPILDANNTVVNVIVQTIDLTELKNKEKELIKAKERAERNEDELKKVQAIAHIGSWYLDLKTNHVTWTDELFKMYGFDPTLPVPPYTEHMKLFTPESWEILSASLANTSKTGEPYELELETVKKDGSNGWMWVRGEAVKNAKGEIVGLWGAAQDISEHVLQKDKLTKVRQSLSMALESSKTGAWELNLFDYTATRTLMHDKIFGYDSLLPLWSYEIFLEHVLEEDREEVDRSFQTAVKMQSDWDFECRIKRADGEIRWIHATGGHSKNSKGLIQFMSGLVKDITDDKNIGLALIEAKEKAEESDRLKSAFLANMSHEIRTPMNGILGFAELLKAPGLSGETQQEYIRVIEKSGERMLNIINDIISISKIESGLMEVHLQESDINEQIEYIFTFFSPEVEAKGLKFHCNTPLPSKESVIETDREKLYAILTNLVKNSIKYTKSGSIEFGYIVISEGETQDSANKKSEPACLEFYVKDTGIGIPKDRQQAMFERFIQIGNSDYNLFQGAGLGLSISRAYVELLGGTIRVESEERKGSCFYFTLPYRNQTVKQKKAGFIDTKLESVTTQSNLKIIIAEDDEMSVKLLKAIVQQIGAKIIIAGTGNEVVEACRRHTDVDLVLMDIQLPGLNGYEATRQIRGFNQNIIIIAQTAYALEGDKQKALESGCNDYIAKPIKKDDLQNLILKHVKVKYA